ncbi:hypothetical protein ASPZODRAFT_2114104 [Penicilliopsis zonata CBS 506.65]|uniref:Uncharacterized protein n=1 Tax=Penicilliopsis zonata CBS 506.65 TaxID=1073090 RepID=A0A1L9S8T8_9EURO|nr:hypothetical protein ASPZODRAFT_2114104 [Penicilliopsis zonata CBS 506.65]OJJ43564.1 hypothetical protein ASPZODRAFT_2114104 [Penicilliopsis zonata CBS 506.65]
MATRSLYGKPRFCSFASRSCQRFRFNYRAKNLMNPPRMNEDELFSYSSGRFLYNEQLRLLERHVLFDVAALGSAIAKHVGHGKVKSIVKLSEGGFNRVFLATMEDGFRAIVKIPYRISGPKTYATASEVATLTFLRSKGFPVPEVYGWSSTTENPVGVEYIIMEHASGVGADTRWFDTTKYQKKALVTGIVDLEKKLFNIPFASIGSLYFKKDLPREWQGQVYQPGTPDEHRDSETYCIGPIADYMFWYGQRAKLGLERGPSTGMRLPHNTIFPGVNSPGDYLELLQKYLAIAPYLLPKDPGDILNQPTLRHPDLTFSNVFVCPDTFNVTCIIDWQHTIVAPLLLAAGYPKLFEKPDPDEPSTELVPPKYPDGYDAMSPEDKAQVDELIRRQTFFYLYRVFNGGLNKVHLKALQDPLILSRQHLVDLAGRQWSGNLMTLRGALIRMRDIWLHVPGKDEKPECPIGFSEQELTEQSENEPMWYNLNKLVDHWRDELGGLSEEGWVQTEQYNYAVEQNKALQVKFSEGGSADDLERIKRGWPFQDHEEFF